MIEKLTMGEIQGLIFTNSAVSNHITHRQISIELIIRKTKNPAPKKQFEFDISRIHPKLFWLILEF